MFSKVEAPDETSMMPAQPVFPELTTLINNLMSALSRADTSDQELRQLWLETQWLKSNCTNGIISLPTKWELLVVKISRGEVGSSLRRHEQIVSAARMLGEAIQAQLNGKIGPH